MDTVHRLRMHAMCIYWNVHFMLLNWEKQVVGEFLENHPLTNILTHVCIKGSERPFAYRTAVFLSGGWDLKQSYFLFAYLWFLTFSQWACSICIIFSGNKQWHWQHILNEKTCYKTVCIVWYNICKKKKITYKYIYVCIYIYMHKKARRPYTTMLIAVIPG